MLEAAAEKEAARIAALRQARVEEYDRLRQQRRSQSSGSMSLEDRRELKEAEAIAARAKARTLRQQRQRKGKKAPGLEMHVYRSSKVPGISFDEEEAGAVAAVMAAAASGSPQVKLQEDFDDVEDGSGPASATLLLKKTCLARLSPTPASRLHDWEKLRREDMQYAAQSGNAPASVTGEAIASDVALTHQEPRSSGSGYGEEERYEAGDVEDEEQISADFLPAALPPVPGSEAQNGENEAAALQENSGDGDGASAASDADLPVQSDAGDSAVGNDKSPAEDDVTTEASGTQPPDGEDEVET